MLSRLRARLTYANVMARVGGCVAFGGRHATAAITAATLVTLATCAANAAPAIAGTVSVSGSAIVYIDSDNQFQDFWAAYDSGTYYFGDFRAPLTAGTGCTANPGPLLSSYSVICPGAGITSVTVNA